MRFDQKREHADVETARLLRGRAGFTLVELLVVFAVLLTALSIFSQTMVSTSRQRKINRENVVAAEAVRGVFETMRNEDFRELFALYNADPDDDPDGPGTAPGNRFAVAGLEAQPGTGGLAGEIILPARLVEEEEESGSGEEESTGFGTGFGGMDSGTSGGGTEGGAGGSSTKTEWQLREDTLDDALGLPRDLDGDSIVEGGDCSDTYILLPVRVRIEWQGILGPRWFEVSSMLAELRPR